MKSIKTIAAVTVLSLASFGAFAQTVVATGSTIESAEAQIAAQAQQAGASYKIIEASGNNTVHMTAELVK
ncbi:DUF1471 domain-containing protein [Erwinia sp. E602]|uniref:YdgH/BhsA/McbA-like domain containing protein n=1 Tax=unclassified Erwinia TaxID=2622719 RepID=UPI00070147C2|nr:MULTISPECIES: YdgH/BhsA/McbA-like domain containing protein [unclassified Erwinia]KQN53777.1 hypothetical protein ASF13_13765 [Erwinia sp. Leaf53]PLV62262.1 hypothetical protein NV64_05270 [Erwinia sp. B116]QUG73846.1 DUF1471 domain-containing protein [Erwinia sp. E602]